MRADGDWKDDGGVRVRHEGRFVLGCFLVERNVILAGKVAMVQLDHVRVGFASCEELRVSALLEDLAGAHDDDLVGKLDCGQLDRERCNE